MTNEMELAKMDIYAAYTTYRPTHAKQRNLGEAIFLVALQDYHSLDDLVHRNAEQFLYPRTRAWQDHYDWAVALAEELNPAWLREGLDRFKAKWDEQRSERKALETEKELKRQLKLERRHRPDEEQHGKRIHPDGLHVPARHIRSIGPAVQPARKACRVRAGDVAPSL